MTPTPEMIKAAAAEIAGTTERTDDELAEAVLVSASKEAPLDFHSGDGDGTWIEFRFKNGDRLAFKMEDHLGDLKGVDARAIEKWCEEQK